jgi:hypothetical protein
MLNKRKQHRALGPQAMKRYIYLITFFFSAINCSYAGEVTELDITASTCWLKERGLMGKENPISIAGAKTGNGCLAFILDEVFNKRFKFCAYSGFDMVNGEEAEYYGCSFSREKDSYMFRAYMSYEGLSRKPDLICRFMCYSE